MSQRSMAILQTASGETVTPCHGLNPSKSMELKKRALASFFVVTNCDHIGIKTN